MVSKKLGVVLGLILILLYMNMLSGCSGASATTPTTGGIQFTVLDAANNPLDGVKVVSNSQPEGQTKVTGISTQSTEGVIFKDLKPGQYQFSLSRADYQETVFNINIVVGKTPNIKVNLNPLNNTSPSPSPAAS